MNLIQPAADSAGNRLRTAMCRKNRSVSWAQRDWSVSCPESIPDVQILTVQLFTVCHLVQLSGACVMLSCIFYRIYFLHQTMPLYSAQVGMKTPINLHQIWCKKLAQVIVLVSCRNFLNVCQKDKASHRKVSFSFEYRNNEPIYFTKKFISLGFL